MAVLVCRAAFIVTPGESHVVGWAHLGSLGNPGELVDLGVPVGGGGNGAVSHDGGEAVAEGDSVVCEPGGEGFASAGGDGLRELALEFEEKEDSGA